MASIVNTKGVDISYWNGDIKGESPVCGFV